LVNLNPECTNNNTQCRRTTLVEGSAFLGGTGASTGLAARGEIHQHCKSAIFVFDWHFTVKTPLENSHSRAW
jgi:hypothetical protein